MPSSAMSARDGSSTATSCTTSTSRASGSASAARPSRRARPRASSRWLPWHTRRSPTSSPPAPPTSSSSPRATPITPPRSSARSRPPRKTPNGPPTAARVRRPHRVPRRRRGCRPPAQGTAGPPRRGRVPGGPGGYSVRPPGSAQRRCDLHGHTRAAGGPAARLAGGRGLDGFRLRPGVLPHDLEQVTRRLVPILQEHGAFRTSYAEETLRERLGLGPRPTSRYAKESI